jgi:plasmid maintenance system antidote protein VapI
MNAKEGSKMNKILKGEIVKKCGTQYLFAGELKIRESEVSKVIRGKKQLDPDEKKVWADALDVEVSEIFFD